MTTLIESPIKSKIKATPFSSNAQSIVHRAIQSGNIQRQIAKARRDAKNAMLDEFLESKDAPVVYAKFTMGYVMHSIANEFISDSMKTMREYGIATPIEAKFKKLDTALEDYVDAYRRIIIKQDKDDFLAVYDNINKNFSAYLQKWVDANIYATRKDMLIQRYGLPVAKERFQGYEIEIFDMGDGQFLYDAADVNSDIEGITGKYFSSIDQAMTLAKNSIPARAKAVEEARIAREAEEEEERKRKEEIVRNA